MKKIAERKGKTYYEFDDGKDLYDFVYKRSHKILSEERGEDVYIPDWVIGCMFEVVGDYTINLKISLSQIDYIIKEVIKETESRDLDSDEIEVIQ